MLLLKHKKYLARMEASLLIKWTITGKQPDQINKLY